MKGVVKQRVGRKRKPLTVFSGEVTEADAELLGILRRIDELREHVGAQSWAHFSRLMGISVPAFDKWRNGKARPYPATLAKMAERAGVNPEWLEFGAGEMLAPAAPPALQAGTPSAMQAVPPGLAVRAQHDLNLDDLVVAYEGALRAFAARGQTSPEPRKLLALTLALYDAAVQSLADDPQDRPQNDPQRSSPEKAKVP